MKQILLILLFIGISVSSFATEGYLLKGTIHGGYTGKIYLSNALGRDSAVVQNNTFEFKGKVANPVLSWLHLKGDSNAAWIYLENSIITVTGNFSVLTENNKHINFYGVSSITGSYSQGLFDSYRNFYNENQKKEDFNTLRLTMLKQMFSANPKQPVCGYILSGMILARVDYSYEEFRDLFMLLDATSMQQGDVNIIKDGLRALNLYGVDQAFIKFNLPDQFDKPIASEKYQGNVTLIDFWASWCGPCRAKHPELIALQKKYQSVRFTVVSISIDKDKNAWRNAITKDGLTWDNLLDTDHRLKDELSLPLIPFNYLLDENGIILAVNQSLEKINLILEKKFK